MVVHKLSGTRYPSYYKAPLNGFGIGIENKADTPLVVGDWYPLIQLQPQEMMLLFYSTTTVALPAGVMKYALMNPETGETIVTGVYEDLDISTAQTEHSATPKTGLLLRNKVLADILPSQTGWKDENWNCLTLCVSITGAASIPANYGIYFHGIIGS